MLDGRLVALENGRSREQLVEYLTTTTRDQPRTVVGLDFAFSFPRWWCAERGWTSAPAVWDAMAAEGERVLSECQPPFWGRPGTTNPHPPDRRFRRTERVDASGAKSVFQIGGAGAVGTGSVRGMASLRHLAEAGFDIWPFGPGGWPRIVEIYPRALTGPVNKSSWRERHTLVCKRFASQSAPMLERAAGSEDAFDAAVSALVMAGAGDQLAALSPSPDPTIAIEGKIWRPA